MEKKSPFVCPNDGETLKPFTPDDVKPKPGQWFEMVLFCPKCDYIKRTKVII
jgi:hypothetical protein